MKAENGHTESVTVRLYGPNTDYVINRERELHVSFDFGMLNLKLLCGIESISV